MISRTLLKRSLPTVQFLRPFTRSSIRRSAHEEDLVNLNELPRQKSLEENYVPLINPTEKYKVQIEELHKFGTYIMACLPKYVQQFSVWKDELTIYVAPSAILPTMLFLKNNTACQFKQVLDVTAADYPSRTNRFDVVYNLLSVRHNSRIRVKTYANETTPVPSITPLFNGANWFERETYDLFGVFSKVILI